jgi:hypothetical protein
MEVHMSIATPERAKAFPYFVVYYPTGPLAQTALREEVEGFQTAYHMARAAAEVIKDLCGDLPAFAEIEGHTQRTDAMTDDEYDDFLGGPGNWDCVASVLPDGRIVAREDSDDPDAVELLEHALRDFYAIDGEVVPH